MRVLPRRMAARVAVAGLLALLIGVAALVLVVTQPWAEESNATTKDDGALVDPNYYGSTAAVCGLVTPADLELALGYRFLDGVEPDITRAPFQGVPGMTKCVYLRERGAGFVGVGVVYAYAEQIFEETRERWAAQGDVENVRGLGTSALWSQGGLMVLEDDKLVAVLPPIESSEYLRIERARRIAKKMMDRLR